MKPTYKLPDKETRKMRKKHGKYGVMYSENYKWELPRFLKEVYGDFFHKDSNRRSLHAHTKFMDKEKAVNVAEEGMPEAYNGFNREHLVDFLKDLPEDTKVSLGRESSPVVYLWKKDKDTGEVKQAIEDNLGKWLRDGENSPWYSSPNEYNEMEEDKEYTPFEVNEGILIRLWWD